MTTVSRATPAIPRSDLTAFLDGGVVWLRWAPEPWECRLRPTHAPNSPSPKSMEQGNTSLRFPKQAIQMRQAQELFDAKSAHRQPFCVRCGTLLSVVTQKVEGTRTWRWSARTDNYYRTTELFPPCSPACGQCGRRHPDLFDPQLFDSVDHLLLRPGPQRRPF